jgi:hypothetical protein
MVCGRGLHAVSSASVAKLHRNASLGGRICGASMRYAGAEDGDDAVDVLLRRQAAAHGLTHFQPLACDAADPQLRDALAADAQQLPLFAGLRTIAVEPEFVAASCLHADTTCCCPLSPYADAADAVSDLEALGMEVLKQELLRLGAKCGGTLAERAARLFRLKGVTVHQGTPDAGPSSISTARAAKPAEAGKRAAVQGPLLPGAKRRG